jgi:alpha-maltose-1-phosphate synthase
MKICQVGTGAQEIKQDSSTAVELVIFNLSKALQKQGNKVSIIDLYAPNTDKELDYLFIRLPRYLEKNKPAPGSPLHIIKKLIFSLKTLILLNKMNKKEKLDIVHIQNQYPGFFIMLFLKRLMKNTKFVYTTHIPFWTLEKEEFNEKYYFKTMLERLCMRMADKIIAVGFSQKKGIIEKAGINENKIEVIWNGVDLNKFKPIKNKDKRLKIISVARISRVKNQMLIIKIIPDIIKKQKNVKFYFIGQEEDKAYLEEINKYIKENKIEDFVEITGAIDNNQIPDFYKKSRIFISASNAEGLPLTILEAMASGCAIILSDIGPHSELGKINEIVYFKKNNNEDLKTKLHDLLSNKKKILRLRNKSLECAKKNFSWNNVALKNLAVYKDL